MNLLSHPGAGWSIRRAKSGDRLDVEAIFRRCLGDFAWRNSPSVEIARMRQTLLAADLFVAEVPQRGVVGFISLETHNAYVPHLFVEADWRLCGVGQGLLEVARDIAGRPLQLDVDIQNKRARAAYARMGWTVVAPAGGRRGEQIRLIGP